MKVISENSDTDLVRQRVKAEVGWALRELAANLSRVVRGAGKPHEIGRQTQALLQTFMDYRDVVGTFPPSDELSGTLSIKQDSEAFARCEDREIRRALAEQQIVRGALQVAASRLLDQLTQERSGEREMYEGIIAIEAIRGETRREMAASTARVRPRGTATRRRKPKA